MTAIIAEARRGPRTSRARPSFLYVFSFLLIALIILAPSLHPTEASRKGN